MKDWYGLAALEVVVVVALVWVLLRHPRGLLNGVLGGVALAGAVLVAAWGFALELAGLGGDD